MCGILSLVNKGQLKVSDLKKSLDIISYRGPDDTAYLLYDFNVKPEVFSSENTSSESVRYHKLLEIPDKNFKVALGHKRLSILDLSPLGLQPMVFRNLSIVFNGEIYNYLEIRTELVRKGRYFQTESDTEVILQAWDEWGQHCLNKFNGMFAFIILDNSSNKLYVVRDRFGVKPLYFSNQQGYFAISSEIKQLRTLPGYSFQLNENVAFEYLKFGFIDHLDETFEKSIFQLKPGNLLIYDLTKDLFSIKKWYKLTPKKWSGSYEEAKDQLYELLKDSVRLRLRSDVPVGSALSGGLDSSIIVCLMKEVLDDSNSDTVLKTISSCSAIKKFDESIYSDKVCDFTNSENFKTYPSFTKLTEDLERITWHMDYPFGSSSQFSQWSVFECAAANGLTVMLDGQGADEIFAGYGGNDTPLYAGLMKKIKFKSLIREVVSYKKAKGRFPIGYLLGGINFLLPQAMRTVFPEDFRFDKYKTPNWLLPFGTENEYPAPDSLQSSLIHQSQVSPLPSLLRYEDRNSMAFSIESRTPFMDYRLIEFSLGLPEEFIYRNGIRKHILRNTFRGRVPNLILDRTDKMGFVSAEEVWFKGAGNKWFKDQIFDNKDLNQFFNKNALLSMISKVERGDVDFNFDPWRVLNFNQWIKQFS